MEGLRARVQVLRDGTDELVVRVEQVLSQRKNGREFGSRETAYRSVVGAQRTPSPPNQSFSSRGLVAVCVEERTGGTKKQRQPCGVW